MSVKIEELDQRHPGVTKAIGDGYAEAASVCLTRHHPSPCVFSTNVNGSSSQDSIAWSLPNTRTTMAWANLTDAVRDGAYAVSLAAVEEKAGLVAIRRAENLSGADYYVSAPGSDPSDFENSFRLEVSGTDSGDASVVKRRLAEKIEQAASGKSNVPALASVVGFKSLLIAIADVK